MSMTPEEQAEYLAIKERLELAEHNSENYKKEAEKFKEENLKLMKVNQEYFIRLTTSLPSPPDQKNKNNDDDEDDVPTAASIVEQLVKRRK